MDATMRLSASISNIVAMSGSSKFTTVGVILSASLGIFGAFMVALHIAKE